MLQTKYATEFQTVFFNFLVIQTEAKRIRSCWTIPLIDESVKSWFICLRNSNEHRSGLRKKYRSRGPHTRRGQHTQGTKNWEDKQRKASRIGWASLRGTKCRGPNIKGISSPWLGGGEDSFDKLLVEITGTAYQRVYFSIYASLKPSNPRVAFIEYLTSRMICLETRIGKSFYIIRSYALYVLELFCCHHAADAPPIISWNLGYIYVVYVHTLVGEELVSILQT